MFAIGPYDLPDDPYFTGPAAYPSFAANLWPARPASLRPALEAYWRGVEGLARTLCHIFALALDLPPAYFDDKTDRHISQLRLMHYPPPEWAPLPGQLRAGAHSDLGMMTLIYSDNDIGGLEVGTLPRELQRPRPKLRPILSSTQPMSPRPRHCSSRSSRRRAAFRPSIRRGLSACNRPSCQVKFKPTRNRLRNPSPNSTCCWPRRSPGIASSTYLFLGVFNHGGDDLLIEDFDIPVVGRNRELITAPLAIGIEIGAVQPCRSRFRLRWEIQFEHG
jgi:hypothetical protein